MVRGECQRLHDRDKSGWWVLITLIPILGDLWLVVECGCLRGTMGPTATVLIPGRQQRGQFRGRGHSDLILAGYAIDLTLITGRAGIYSSQAVQYLSIYEKNCIYRGGTVNLSQILFCHRRTHQPTGLVLKYYLVAILLMVIALLRDHAFGFTDSENGIGPVIIIAWLVLIYPAIMVRIKRFHDRNKSGWWALISVIPVVGVVWIFIECGCLRGTVGENRYGPDPLGLKII
jgi:uncharacterized membrane protein YhaH (DUF805 family)